MRSDTSDAEMLFTSGAIHTLSSFLLAARGARFRAEIKSLNDSSDSDLITDNPARYCSGTSETCVLISDKTHSPLAHRVTQSDSTCRCLLSTPEFEASSRRAERDYNSHMKPLPPPNIPGKTEFQRFDNAVRRVLTVSKEELLKREEAEKKERAEKRRPKK